ncbi:MAG: cellulosome anchor protein [Firmicutes bacterium]|nr:cellulosome anchor protein [Bacillota bacterium]
MLSPRLIGMLILALALAGSPALAQEVQTRSGDSFVLENEFIAIVVNARNEDTGRFSVNTTGGDPEREGDERMPLIYGTENPPGPWTSYTTVRIDGRDYVFGGQTGKRAGRTGQYGQMVEPPTFHEGREIRTAFRMGDILVTQVISIAKGITTGNPDTARIEYVVANEGSQTRTVGLRIMLDTMLGANDGAPFQVSGQALTADHGFRHEAIPDYFQAFDSLANPRVVSQGTLRAFDTTVPDEVYFSNWGSLADGIWDFDFSPGRDFTRVGEGFELDSAVALYWDPAPLDPGQSRRYVIYYGLGGITIAPGQLSLGVTSPASVEGHYDEPVVFEVRAYVENTGDWIARDAVVRLENLGPLQLVQGSPQVSLGDLAPRASRQVSWRVAAPPETFGEFVYRVFVTAENTDPNRVDRSVTVVAPASLSAAITGPTDLQVVDGRWSPVPFAVEAQITNTGELEARGVEAEIQMPIGLSLARGDRAVWRLGSVEPGQTVTARWHLVPTGVVGNLPVSVELTSDNARIDSRFPIHFVNVPRLDAALQIVDARSGASEVDVAVGDLFAVEVRAQNVRPFFGAAFELRFDPAVLQVIGGARGVGWGRLFVDVNPITGERERLGWIPAAVDNRTGVVRIAGSRSPKDPLPWGNDSLATIRFRAVGEGRTALRLVPVADHPFLRPDAQQAFVADGEGHAVNVVVDEAVVFVRGGEEQP